jgi:hypothetical protein
MQGKQLENTLYTESGRMSSEILTVILYIVKSVISQEPSGIKSAVQRKKSKG